MSPKVRKEYTPQQKADAVQIALSSDQSVRQVAQNLGIPESNLNRWVRAAKRQDQPNSVSAPLTQEERQELVQLRRQVKQLEMERDFAKKAAAFFARDLP